MVIACRLSKARERPSLLSNPGHASEPNDYGKVRGKIPRDFSLVKQDKLFLRRENTCTKIPWRNRKSAHIPKKYVASYTGTTSIFPLLIQYRVGWWGEGGVASHRTQESAAREGKAGGCGRNMANPHSRTMVGFKAMSEV